ncbi:hypothetical protein HMPREF0208_00360 [Citrobacter koseri]|nr:hypothetical protein HMPREF0208_00360 [Citrobacter koseri]
MGAIFGLRPDNSLAGSETLEGGFMGGMLTQPRKYSEVVRLYSRRSPFWAAASGVQNANAFCRALAGTKVANKIA